jgi:hypothetical protein
MLIPGTLWAKGSPCTIEGTWYGTNEAGATYVITITRTGAQIYSAVGQSPADSTSTPGVLADFFGTQGDLSRTGPGVFDSTWMDIWQIDPSIYGFEIATIVTYGQIELTSCNTWETTFTSDFLLHDFGQDAFEEGLLFFSSDPYGASYKRLPKYP